MGARRRDAQDGFLDVEALHHFDMCQRVPLLIRIVQVRSLFTHSLCERWSHYRYRGHPIWMTLAGEFIIQTVLPVCRGYAVNVHVNPLHRVIWYGMDVRSELLRDDVSLTGKKTLTVNLCMFCLFIVPVILFPHDHRNSNLTMETADNGLSSYS